MRANILTILTGALLLGPILPTAQAGDPAAHSDWLELVKGHRGEVLGAELMNIDSKSSPDYHEVTLAIPKTAIEHPDTIEEVVVVGRMPEEREPILDVSYQWVDDYDKDSYGLVIRLSKETEWPIRLYMHSDEGYIR